MNEIFQWPFAANIKWPPLSWFPNQCSSMSWPRLLLHASHPSGKQMRSLLLPWWNIWRVVFSHFSFLWCHRDPGINVRLFSLTFFKSVILVFSALFLENNFARCKLFRWSAEILAVGKAKRNQATLTWTPSATLQRFTLCHLARSFRSLLAHYVPRDFPGFLYLLLLG